MKTVWPRVLLIAYGVGLLLASFGSFELVK